MKHIVLVYIFPQIAFFWYFTTFMLRTAANNRCFVKYAPQKQSQKQRANLTNQNIKALEVSCALKIVAILELRCGYGK